jgi:hypothetical protein
VVEAANEKVFDTNATTQSDSTECNTFPKVLAPYIFAFDTPLNIIHKRMTLAIRYKPFNCMTATYD